MLREEGCSRVLLYLLIIFLVNFSKASSYILRDNCLEFDVVELEDYLSRNIENVPTIDMMIGGFKCPVAALPFGALKSDWARLLLLQTAQPKDSILSKKLGRLFKILVIAYFQIEERYDIIQSGILSRYKYREKKLHRNIEKQMNPSQSKFANNFTKGQGGTNKKKGLNKNKDDTFTDISGITISNSNQKSIMKNSKGEGTTRSVFTTKISTMKSDGLEERDSKKISDRSDFPVSYDYVAKFNLERIENVNSLEIFDVKTTSEQSRVYSNKISTNSSESFNQSPSNRQTNDVFQVFEKIPWNFSNKLEKPPIYKKLRKPSLDNDFWKYIVISRNVSLTTPSEPKIISEIKNADNKSKGSSTKDDEQHSDDRQGIHIECNGKKHNE